MSRKTTKLEQLAQNLPLSCAHRDSSQVCELLEVHCTQRMESGCWSWYWVSCGNWARIFDPESPRKLSQTFQISTMAQDFYQWFMASFSETEEAFLFKNLRNIINVWSGGSGQARINLFVNNGKAELQLNYRLGHPEVSHLPPQRHQHQPHVQPRRMKSQKRQARDNARAARYQAGKRAAISSSTAATSSKSPSPLISVLESRYFHSTSNPPTLTPVVTSSATGFVSKPATTTTVNSSRVSPAISSAVGIPATMVPPCSFDNLPSTCPADQSMVSLDSNPTTTYTPWTMPARRFVDCSHCEEDIAIHVQPLPCYNCGEWFHHECLPGHECVIRNDIPVEMSENG